ncbi:hypothetical protein CRUP_008301 [Coryphaenoides rupestris]|nr:hypothetical protein CRUP_008301 [Coryphaenoides rupestris]
MSKNDAPGMCDCSNSALALRISLGKYQEQSSTRSLGREPSDSADGPTDTCMSDHGPAQVDLSEPDSASEDCLDYDLTH